jgi:hypothetical protein
MKFYIITRRNVSEGEISYYLQNTNTHPAFEKEVIVLRLTKKQKQKIEQMKKKDFIVEEVILGGKYETTN